MNDEEIRKIEIALTKIENEIGMIGRGITIRDLNNIVELQNLYNKACQIRQASLILCEEFDRLINKQKVKNNIE